MLIIASSVLHLELITNLAQVTKLTRLDSLYGREKEAVTLHHICKAYLTGEYNLRGLVEDKTIYRLSAVALLLSYE